MRSTCRAVYNYKLLYYSYKKTAQKYYSIVYCGLELAPSSAGTFTHSPAFFFIPSHSSSEVKSNQIKKLLR